MVTIYVFRLKVSKTEYGKGVPQLGCKDYSGNSFENCLEEKVKSTCLSILSCVPFWFTDNEEEMCNRSIIISETDQKFLAAFFTDIHVDNIGAFPSCPMPCNSKTVHAEMVMEDEAVMDDYISIRLDQQLEIQLIKLSFDFFHGLLPAIGGDLGLTRNLLWLCITLTAWIEISKRWISGQTRYSQ